jgi:hypothetical protein
MAAIEAKASTKPFLCMQCENKSSAWMNLEVVHMPKVNKCASVTLHSKPLSITSVPAKASFRHL